MEIKKILLISIKVDKGHFTEGVDFAYWWSCIGKCLRLQPAQQACFLNFAVKCTDWERYAV